MQLNSQHRNQFLISWVILFYILAVYKFTQGFWLFQFDPFLFTPRFDGISWIIMQSGIHRAIMNNSYLPIVFDMLFYGFPLVVLIGWHKFPKLNTILCLVWLFVNWWYVQIYVLFPTNSIEAHTPWLLFPFLFAMRSLKSFYFMMHGLRYFFLYFFFSAGIWKLVQGGAFDLLQMSGILLDQHKEWLLASGDYWQANMIKGIISLPLLGFALYWAGLLIELFFIVGFFTRKKDNQLIILFCLFLLFDYFIMRIPYWEVTPFLCTLYFSRYKQPL